MDTPSSSPSRSYVSGTPPLESPPSRSSETGNRSLPALQMTPRSHSPSPSSVSGTASPSSSPDIDFGDIEERIDCTLPRPTWTIPTQQPTPPQPTAPIHSEVAQALLGASIPANTRKASESALRAFGLYCIEKFQPQHRYLLERPHQEPLPHSNAAIYFRRRKWWFSSLWLR